jgi:hypothetical protein
MLYWLVHIGMVVGLAGLVLGLLAGFAISLQATQLSYTAARIAIEARHTAWDEVKREELMMDWAIGQVNPGFAAPRIARKTTNPAVVTAVPWRLASVASDLPKFSRIWRKHHTGDLEITATCRGQIRPRRAF